MSDNKKTVIALGYFDSVHLGHRIVIESARRYADEHNASLLVFTFGDNLRALLTGNDEKIVYTEKERLVIYKSLGADDVYFAPVNFNFLSLGKLAFLNMINRKYDVLAYFCGEDYKFGKFAKGTTEDLKRFAKEKGQECIIVETVKANTIGKISTTVIKRMLKSGDVKSANLLLKEAYSVTGVVFEDRKVGHEIGFPTINVKLPKEKLHLKDGVYAGRITLDGKEYRTMINYGARPTFRLNEKLIEAHILDYSGELYGLEVTLKFDAFLRDIYKFSNAESLKKQLEQDLDVVRSTNYD